MMKKSLLSTVFFGLTLGAFGQTAAFWDFNSTVNDASTATGVSTPATGTGSLALIGGITQTYAAGNAADLNTTDNSGFQTTGYPAQGGGSATGGLQFDVDLTGKNDITFECWQRLSNTAANTWILQYTTDKTGVSTGGTVQWTNAQTYTFTPAASGTGDTWYFRTADLTSVTALDNNANAAFRFVSAFDPVAGQYLAARSTSTYAGSGTCRFDLVTIAGVVPLSPASASIAAASNFIVVQENAGTINVPVTIANANTATIKVAVGLAAYTDATQGSDFTWTTDTLTIAASSNGIFNFPLTIVDDNLAERAERIIVKLIDGVNVLNSATNNYQIIYIKDNDYVAPVPTNELGMTLLSSFSNGAGVTNSAEIVAYDSTNFRLYIANSIGAKLDIVDFSNPAAPTLLNSISVTPYGNINSVTVYNGVVALAMENANAQTNGSVVFLDQNGVFISQVTVGAMPDMITFNHSHTKIFIANEGEPNATYSADPEGSVSIIDLTPGYAALTNANVTNVGFTDYNMLAAELRDQGIRIFATSASVAQDIEPEYVTISSDDSKAFVSLQENNAMAVIDIATATIDTIYALGYSNYMSGNGLDASDQSGSVLIASAPVKGAYMPDAIAYSTIAGQGYVFSANEGDSREFGPVVDAARISTLTLDETVFPDQHILKNNKLFGRLNGLTYSGDTDSDGDLDEIHTMGGRSFSIWNAATGQLVFDSKDLIEQITANHPVFGAFFNASNGTGTATLKNRSDDKGPEPEGVSTAFINGSHYLFVSQERIGGVLTFNVNDPANPIFVGYYNNRTLTGSGPDLGAEGIIYISAAASPNDNDLVILANEVSSTLSVYQLNTCAQLAGATITSTENTFCAGDSTYIRFTPATGTTFEWLMDDAVIANATNDSLTVEEAGIYRLHVQSSTFACADTSNAIEITVNDLPTVTANVSDATICAGEQVTFTGSGAATYTWNNSVTNGTAIAPTTGGTYMVTGTDANGCIDTDNITLVVNTLPSVTANVSEATICAGDEVTFTGSGATTYTWNNSVVNGTAIAPTTGGTFTVTGTDINGCVNTDDVALTINTLPTVTANVSDAEICAGDEVTFTGSGATTYTWNNSVTNGTAIAPATGGTFTVTGTDANGCENTDDVTLTINALPTVTANVTDATICPGQNVTFTGSGATTYTWNNGVTNGTATAPTAAGTYTVTGTDANGCENTDDVAITLNPVPSVNLGTDITVCDYETPVTLNAGSHTTYDWSTGSATSTIQVTATGNYSVIVTNAEGCTGTDAIQVTVESCAGIDELAMDVNIFPNPTQGTVYVTFGTALNNASIQLMDMAGKIIFQQADFNGDQLTLDLSNHAAGVYMVNIQQDEKVSQYRIAKH